MSIPLVDAKLTIKENINCDLKYLNGNEFDLRYQFSNVRQYMDYTSELYVNQKYQVITKFNDKLYRWIGTITYKSEKEHIIVISNPTNIEIKDDSRKERILVKDKVNITDIEYDSKSINLHGKTIPAIVKDISETGILIYTNLDFSLIENFDNLVTLSFDGDNLKELQQKKVKIKRIFHEENKFYYGCQFNIRDFDDLKQINKLIQYLKKK